MKYLFDLYDQVKGHVGVIVVWKDMVFVNDTWYQVKLKYMKALKCQKEKTRKSRPQDKHFDKHINMFKHKFHRQI